VSWHYETIIGTMSPDSVIQGRKGELWFPLLSIARHIDSFEKTEYYQQVKTFAEQSIKLADQESLDEWSTALLLGLESLFKELFATDVADKTLVTEPSLIVRAKKEFLEEDRQDVSTSWVGQQLKRWQLGYKKRKKKGFEYTIRLSEVQDRIKRYMPHRPQTDDVWEV